MSKASMSHPAPTRISGDTESSDITAYQDALVRFDARTNLDQVRKIARRNGWNAEKLLRDVWQELNDPDYTPWLAVPELV